MTVEEKLKTLGLVVPALEDLYRSNASGAHYVSHFPVQNVLYLSGTVPIKDGKAYLPGVLGRDLTVAQGYEAARYAALTTLANERNLGTNRDFGQGAARGAAQGRTAREAADEAAEYAKTYEWYPQRAGRPENVAQAVLFLVDNDYVTGISLPVDGGRTIYAGGT